MQFLKTFGCSVIAFGILMTVAGPASAQDADTDTAKALLSRGIELFEAMRYDEAQQTLLEIDPAQLPGDEDRAQLETYINSVSVAMVQQAAARESFTRARRMLNDGQFAEAEAMFARVIANEYVPGPLKKDAQSLMAVATAKRQRRQSQAAEEDQAESPAGDGAVAADTGDQAEAQLQEAAAGDEAAGDARITEAMATASPRQTEEADQPTGDEPAIEESVAEEPAADQPVEDPAAQDAPLDPEAQRRLAAQAAAIRAKAEARRLVDQGRMALEVDNAAKAAELFRRALDVAPQMAEAQQGLDQATALLDRTPSGSMATLIRNRRIVLQQARVDFDKAMAEARRLLAGADKGADFRTAAERADYAISILEANKQFFPTNDYTTRKAQAEGLSDRIAEEHDYWQRGQARRQQEQATESAEAYRRAQLSQRLAKIETLMERARGLEREQNWDQAIETAQEILRLEPHHAWAAAKVEAWRQFSQVEQQARYHDERLNQEREHIVALERDKTPWYEILRFPKNWDDITRRRAMAGREHDSPADRETRQKLEEIQPVVQFDESPFEEVITYLKTVTEANISPNWAELDSVGVDRDTPVRLELTNVTAARALDEILERLGSLEPLTYTIRGGVVTITTERSLASFAEPRVYDISDLLVTTPDFVGPEMDLDTGGGGDGGGGDSPFGDRGGQGGGGYQDGGSAGQERQFQIQRLLEAVQATAPGTWSDEGQVDAIGSVREFNGQFIIYQTPAIHEKIENLFNDLRDAQAITISVEYRTITVSSGFLNDVGLSLNFFLNTGSETARTGTVDPITGARVLSTGSSALPQWANTSAWSNHLTALGASQRSSAFTAFPATEVPNNIANVASSATGGSGAMFLQGSFLDDIQVDFLVRATQADQRTMSFIAPRVSMSNGQRAFMMIGTEQAYVEDLEIVTAENVAEYDPEPGTIWTGNVLDVQATASQDRRYVTLTLRPFTSKVIDMFEYAVEETVLSEDTGSRSGVIQLPLRFVNQVNTTVTVPDGGTLLIAGERRAGDVTREMGVPILNKIPIINRLFSNRSMSRDEHITLLLVKPTIIINREYEEDLYPQ